MSEADPRKSRYPKPPFPGDQQQPSPGLSSRRWTPAPDHGETSYVGKGLLDGQGGADHRRVIPGSGGRWRSLMRGKGRTSRSRICRSSKVDAEETQSWIEKAGRRALLLPGDHPATRRIASAMVERVVSGVGPDRRFGEQCGGSVRSIRTLDDVTAEQDDRHVVPDQCVRDVCILAQAAVRHMKPGASIINTTSQQAKVALKSMLIYAATKGAIV